MPSAASPDRRARDRRRAAWTTAVAALVLHTLAVVWLWLRWETGLRGTWLVWTDFPVSLLYLELRGAWLLVGSLLAGGAWWAALGAALSLFVGFVVGRR